MWCQQKWKQQCNYSKININSSYHSLPESDSVEVDPSYKRSTDILPNGI